MNDQGVLKLARAYLALSAVEQEPLRSLLQGSLCELRDALATATGVDAELVQDHYDALARAGLSEITANFQAVRPTDVPIPQLN